MNDETTNLDQADEEILTPTASDEALEAAAGTESGAETSPNSGVCFNSFPRCC
jgi:hypothetical protein